MKINIFVIFLEIFEYLAQKIVEAEMNQLADDDKLEQQRAAFICRHFSFLDGRKTLEILRHRPHCGHLAVSTLLECEAASGKLLCFCLFV